MEKARAQLGICIKHLEMKILIVESANFRQTDKAKCRARERTKNSCDILVKILEAEKSVYMGRLGWKKLEHSWEFA